MLAVVYITGGILSTSIFGIISSPDASAFRTSGAAGDSGISSGAAIATEVRAAGSSGTVADVHKGTHGTTGIAIRIGAGIATGIGVAVGIKVEATIGVRVTIGMDATAIAGMFC